MIGPMARGRFGFLAAPVVVALVACTASCFSSFTLGYSGGTRLVYRLDVRSFDDLSRASTVLSARLTAAGFRSLVVTSGTDRIEIEIPSSAAADVDKVKRIVGRRGVLRFAMVSDRQDPAEIDRIRRLKAEGGSIGAEAHDVAFAGGKAELRAAWADAKTADLTLLDTAGAIDGTSLSSVEDATNDQGTPVVRFSLDPQRRKLFLETTTQNVGRRIAIVLEDRILSTPVIRAPVEGAGIIQGDFTADEVTELVAVLKGGPLDVVPVLVSEGRVP